MTGTNLDAYLSTSLAQGWLLQAVDRGDLIRILEPLLILLLHPDCARCLLLILLIIIISRTIFIVLSS